MKTVQQYKELSRREFTRAARRYDGDQAGVYKLCRHDYPPILEEIKHLKQFDTLLDAGCGTAPMLSLLTREFPDKHFTGLDLTPAMIEVAQSKHLPNTTLVVGDCENMPFEDNSFDIVINSQSLHHYPTPQAFFDNVKWVLKPGGSLILRDMSACAPLAWLFNHVEMPVLNKVGYGDVAIHTTSEVRHYCQQAGLDVVTLEHRFPLRVHLVARKPMT